MSVGKITAGLVVICKCVRAVDFKASCLKRLMNLTAIKSRGRTQNSRLTIKSPQCSIIGFHTYVTLVKMNERFGYKKMHRVKHLIVYVYNLPSVGGKD